MKAEAVIQGEKNYLVGTYVRPDVVFTHGKGAYLFDTDGNRYLDFTSGIAVTALGHSDAAWATAVAQQAAALTHVSNLYHTAPHVKLAQNLVEHSFADKVFFCNSGAEANEAALKFARKWKRLKIKDSRLPISNHQSSIINLVAFSGGFH
ncbi:MAG: aminotransferase class III-fold pyridoxal phosphate-dependent enzyme, partial [Anaerolineae bacterium]